MKGRTMTFTLTKKAKERVEAALRPAVCRCQFPRLECPACHRDCDACREGYDEYRRKVDAGTTRKKERVEP